MSQEPQADIGARLDEPAVVEFGADEPAPERPRASRIFTAVRRDWRLVPVISGLSMVAIFASLVGEWQITTFTQQDFLGPGQPVQSTEAGIGELGGFSAGYLIGIFLLMGCMSLLLFGRPAMRDQMRVLGLTAAGVVGAVLVSIAVWLDNRSAAFAAADIFIGTQGSAYDLAYGRGLTMAFLGVAGLAVAFYLAGRLLPAPHAQPAAPAAGARAEPGPRPEAAERLDWPWRRPRSAPEPDDLDSGLQPPADLTVGPTAPFVPMQEGRAAMPDGKRDAPST